MLLIPRLGIVTLYALPLTRAFSKLKFKEWFPMFEADLKPSWTTGDCQAVHQDYFFNRNSERDQCGALLECILENTNEKRKTTMAAASVVLGLAPPMLATLGQSLAEISLLSSQRPVLSFLIALGAPAIYPTRVFEYSHPHEALRSLPGNLSLKELRPSSWLVITVTEYVLVIGAVASNIQVAIDMGARSVLAWACNSWWMPLLWVVVNPISLHGACFAGYYIMTLPQRGTSRATRCASPAERSWNNYTWMLIKAEVLPTVNRERSSLPCTPPTTLAILLQISASALAFVHIVLGTMILSSLIFIGFHDTLRILSRLISSALVCRGVSIFELAGIQKASRAEGQPYQHHTTVVSSRKEGLVQRASSMQCKPSAKIALHRNNTSLTI